MPILAILAIPYIVCGGGHGNNFSHSIHKEVGLQSTEGVSSQDARGLVPGFASELGGTMKVVM